MSKPQKPRKSKRTVFIELATPPEAKQFEDHTKNGTDGYRTDDAAELPADQGGAVELPAEPVAAVRAAIDAVGNMPQVEETFHCFHNGIHRPACQECQEKARGWKPPTPEEALEIEARLCAKIKPVGTDHPARQVLTQEQPDRSADEDRRSWFRERFQRMEAELVAAAMKRDEALELVRRWMKVYEHCRHEADSYQRRVNRMRQVLAKHDC